MCEHRACRIAIAATIAVAVFAVPGHAQVPASAAAAAAALAVSFPEPGLSLAEAERMLQLRNRDLQSARRAVEAAQANTLSAGARPNPTLSLGLSSINPQAGIGSGGWRDKTIDTSVRLDQVFERGNKLDLRLATARSVEQAAGEDFQDTFRQQRLALRLAYYDLRLGQERVAVLRDNAQLYERTLAAADLRLRAGDIAAADVSRIRVDALRAANDARGAQADLQRAQSTLAYLIGAERDAAALRASDPWPSPGPGTGVVTDELVERRPDVRAARSRLDAAQSARELSRSLRTRDVSLGVQYDRYPVHPTNGLGSGTSYGVFMSVPLFTRYHFEGEIARAEADVGAAEDGMERARAIARAELGRASGDLQAARDRLQRFEGSLLAEAGRSAEAAEFAYRNGALGVMDLLDARRTLRAIQVEAAVARADLARALASWEAGLGLLAGEVK
jgi:cobalt-zinc-cadmium efflux system outer membrane protein